jgi:hypothetical protein
MDCHLIVEPKEINNAFTDFILIRVRYFFNLRVPILVLFNVIRTDAVKISRLLSVSKQLKVFL